MFLKGEWREEVRFRRHVYLLISTSLLSLSLSLSLSPSHPPLQVVVPLYHAAFRFSTPKLLACCCHYLLTNYDEVEDPDREALLHVLDNTPPASS